MRRPAVVAALVTAFVVGSAVAAAAHPLGNFTVNHYDGLVLTPHAVIDNAVVNTAEIPTEQDAQAVDADGDGTVSAAERMAYATLRCNALARSVALTVNRRPAVFAVTSAGYDYAPGAAGLRTARLTCSLNAPADLTSRSGVVLIDGYDGDRIGWHEITATGRGTHLDRSPVPAASVSDELRHYPNELLSSPLDVRRVTLSVLPGAGASTTSAGAGNLPGAGLASRMVGRLDRLFSGLAGSRHLTLGVGLLGVVVSLVLGAAHAALPGHGKTVMAAYLAGRHRSVRDAVAVGATVALTHTAGVLVLGLLLTVSSSIAGEQVTSGLGVVSGVLVAMIGGGLLTAAVRRRRAAHGDTPGHARDHHDDHHDDHDHGHGHGHGHDRGRGHGHGHPASFGDRRPSRAGLVGMGVAGGLVPSPSALVVLLGAAALGRTWFGVVLVMTYGMGMAATLTAVGLLLARLAGRWAGRLPRAVASGRLAAATPLMTAAIVVVVGLGLAARSLATV
jgi:nickel/cobalt transporter (NicO) family protein